MELTFPARTSKTTLQIVTSIPEYDKEMSFNNFSYPLDVDMVKLIQEYSLTGQVEQRAINNFTQRFLHNPVNRCYITAGGDNTHTGDIFLLFVVKSKNDHFDQRNAIRETWGNELYLKKFIIKTVFILGTPVNESLESLNPIWKEIKQFNDIILMDFHDTYFNNTLKTSTSFNWVPEFCPQARFVVLVDDDIYVSLETLVIYLEHLPLRKHAQLYMGQTYMGYKPHRNSTSKWYVPVSEYPWDAYPSFISAGTVIMTMDFVKDVRIAMRYTKLFRLDDIYLAILAYKLGVVPVTNKNVYGYQVMFGSTKYSDLLTSHGFTPQQLKLFWNAHVRTIQ
ncbi:lactosylceramide 1,3-N-acetyl-beta-D-glucosaminyltransferase-like [Mizuhopecten yessoensis]|uniref:lactosylceramide 1,3-N-acetyl-beta-D-glucosaminyltransferase-like n=1 Tax=Mizuhopecten yessoensis TaxID=6573 RepID=UPI000B458F18|nr:lactosylceramide 1,3-N-acetyl-beta-D-glucosaminyltransferase-like [Mizuhopecten yessoensis]